MTTIPPSTCSVGRSLGGYMTKKSLIPQRRIISMPRSSRRRLRRRPRGHGLRQRDGAVFADRDLLVVGQRADQALEALLFDQRCPRRRPRTSPSEEFSALRTIFAAFPAQFADGGFAGVWQTLCAVMAPRSRFGSGNCARTSS